MREGLSVADRASPKQKRNLLLEKKLSKDSVTSTKFSESTEELQNQSSHSSESHSTKKLKEFEKPPSSKLNDLTTYVSDKKRSVASANKNLNYFQNCGTISLDYSKEKKQLSKSKKREVSNELIDSVSVNTPELKSESLDSLDKSTNELIAEEETKENHLNIDPDLVHNNNNNNNSQNNYNFSSFKKTDTSIPTYSIPEYTSYISPYTKIPSYYPHQNNLEVRTSVNSYYTNPSGSISPNSVPTYQASSFHQTNPEPTFYSPPFVPSIYTPEVHSIYPNYNMDANNNTMDFLNMYSSNSPRNRIGNSPSIYQNSPSMEYSQEKTFSYDAGPNNTFETSSTKYTNPSGVTSYEYGAFSENPQLSHIRKVTEEHSIMNPMNSPNIIDPTRLSIPGSFPNIDSNRLMHPDVGNSTTILEEMTTRNETVDMCKTIESPPDYSRATHSSQVVEKKFVHEGYDTIKIPKYREVEIVEKLVEVPVVHTINKYVHKHEIKQVEKLVKRPINKYIETKIEVPELYYKDKVVEIPEMHEIVKIVEKPQVQERIIYKSKIETKIIPKYIEVPVVKIIDKYEEYDDIQEVVKTVHVKKIVEIPNEVIKRVKVPIKKIIEQPNYVPIIKYRDVPIEKIRYVPKIKTIEHVKTIPKIIDIPVPVKIPKIKYIDKPVYINKYIDHYVNVPVSKRIIPVYKDGGKKIIEIPIHKPYIVNHDTIVPKSINNSMLNGSCSVYTKRLDINSLSPMKKNELYEMVNRKPNGMNRAATVSNFFSSSNFGSAPVLGMNNNNNNNGLSNSSINGRYPNDLIAGGSNDLLNSSPNVYNNNNNNISMVNGSAYHPVRVRSNSCARFPTDVIGRTYHSNGTHPSNYTVPNIPLENYSSQAFYSNPLGSSSSMNFKNGRNDIGMMHSTENFNVPSMINSGRMSNSHSMYPTNSMNPSSWKQMKSYSFSNLPGSFSNPVGSFPTINNQQNMIHSSVNRNRLESSNIGSRSPSVGSIDGISAYAVEYVGELNDKLGKSNRSSEMIYEERNFEGSNYSFTK